MARIRVPVRGSVGKAVNTGGATTVRQTIVQQTVKGSVTSGVAGVASTIWPLISQIPAPVTDLAALSTAGMVVFDGTDIITRDLAVSAPLTITNPTGAGGNPTIGLPTAALTKTDDANVTLTLGGTPGSALVAAVSITVGWDGQLSVARGGSGAATLTGFLVGNGTGPFTAVTNIPAADVTGLATVATSGAYGDLSGKPTLLVSPLTTKGDLWGFDTANDRLPVGADGYVLTADSTQALGVKWAASGGGGGTGTVTSVALTAPSFLSVGGSPITTSGTLALTLATQAPASMFAGPATGSAAAPTFRALLGTDLPVATTGLFGAVKPDGSTITVSGGVISAAASAAGANPTGSIGLTAVNGSATTFTRSDSTHALSQAIAPTWTGQHIFTGSQTGATGTTGVIPGSNGTGVPVVVWVASGAATDAKQVHMYSSAASFVMSLLSDASSVEHLFMEVDRSGLTMTKLTLGNATDLAPTTINGVTTVAASLGTFSPTGNPHLVLSNSNATGQSPLDFIINGTLCGRVRADYAGDLSLVSFAGNIDIFVGGDAGVGHTAIQLTHTAIQGWGPTTASLLDMTPDAGTFSGTLRGFASTVTNTCRWNRMGNLVVLTFSTATGSSSAATFDMITLPASIVPATAQLIAVPAGALVNSGAVAQNVAANIAAGSNIVTFWNNGNASGWTTGSTKGITTEFSISYMLN